ncbi:hypothetical protein, partial [Rhizobium sp.]|uniref:hypothetical protein n=1 Tax=Rhizobium sp. TaxID=391 RepID=UPI0028A62266
HPICHFTSYFSYSAFVLKRFRIICPNGFRDVLHYRYGDFKRIDAFHRIRRRQPLVRVVDVDDSGKINNDPILLHGFPTKWGGGNSWPLTIITLLGYLFIQIFIILF